MLMAQLLLLTVSLRGGKYHRSQCVVNKESLIISCCKYDGNAFLEHCNFKTVPFHFADLKIRPEILRNS